MSGCADLLGPDIDMYRDPYECPKPVFLPPGEAVEWPDQRVRNRRGDSNPWPARYEIAKPEHGCH